MIRRRRALDERQVDDMLHEALSDLERPTLGSDFRAGLAARLRPSPVPSAARKRSRWLMRLYWLAAVLAALWILFAIGSPSPTVTWTISAALILGLSLALVPQMLFRRGRRTGLMDLILYSMR